jgi:hypothetical protein
MYMHQGAVSDLAGRGVVVAVWASNPHESSSKSSAINSEKRFSIGPPGIAVEYQTVFRKRSCDENYLYIIKGI